MTAVSRFVTAPDGLRLHLRDHPPARDEGRLPVVCLPGLTRNAADFEPLAAALAEASSTTRRVVAVDYRGRGLSVHDSDWHRYDLPTEQADLLAALDELGIARAHFIGTSRGGLHIMGLADEHLDRMASAVLNDIGPVIEVAGLRRIKGYVGRPAEPDSIAHAVRLLKMSEATAGFDGLSEEEWTFFARATFGDEGDLHLRYDPRIAETLDALDLNSPLPALWEQYEGLASIPLLTIRGENSDLLSEATLAEMLRRGGAVCRALTVPGQAHAPLLADARTIAAIDVFLADADRHGTDPVSGIACVDRSVRP